MTTHTIGTMMATVRHMTAMDEAITNRSRRDVASTYSSIMALERKEIGHDLVPDNHVQWIHGLCVGAGVHRVRRSLLHDTVEYVCSMGFSPDSTVDGDEDADAPFDPTTHFIVTTDVTMLSYILEAEVAHVPLLGPGARGVSPSLKCCVLWWESNA